MRFVEGLYIVYTRNKEFKDNRRFLTEQLERWKSIHWDRNPWEEQSKMVNGGGKSGVLSGQVY